ncbi:hypothetical protein AGDE_05676 [Angomonas deanei]|uniref:Uncharacterized protein n=1 Tax=Angomonas deanei TaxID=59799 RepID=A0A7G2CGF0_9TRYP|nr:hypothetical protein AGDE_05676 [Angomonas deanei]CAD2218041.1 hypothetical protein, conserved [Angomonas deanei]|eukprot:EPY38253.1 hypothetical protein AGDE_05676 [Angomonas deanei]
MTTPYLFGTEDCKVDNKLVSALCHMCTPDKAVDKTSLFGDFAFSEMCVSDEMTLEHKKALEAIRAPIQGDFINRVVEELRSKGDSKPALAKLADAIDGEYKRLLKVFFLRVRCFIVIRNSTNEPIGRIVAFPEQIADDYGNNLDEHNETGMGKMKVLFAQQSNKSRIGTTLYVGHGAGATMAQICGCLKDEPAVTFDSTYLSEILTRNIFREELPKKFELAERKEGEFPWNILSYYFEPACSSATCSRRRTR